MKRLILLTAVALVSQNCLAEWKPIDEDLDNCRWVKTGESMSEKLCNEFRAEVAHDKAVAERQKLYLERQREDRKNEEATRELERQEKNKQLENDWATEKKANEAANKKEIEAFEKKERAENKAAQLREKAAQSKENAIKDKCGVDYKTPQIGMKISRANECVGKFRLSAQINRADGVVSTYEGNGMYLHVMDGHIVSWGKY